MKHPDKDIITLSGRSSGAQILYWSAELPSASQQDPLGLNLRVAARLSSELLHCITSITPRARYYSFFPWAFQDYWENEKGKPGDRGEKQGILARERALVLGSVLHHGNSTCKGGALGGSDKAEVMANGMKPEQSVDLDKWQHLEYQRSQFDAAYKASLVNLELFETNAVNKPENLSHQPGDLDEKDVSAIEIRKLSANGLRLYNAYAESIKSTQYIKESANLMSKLPNKMLREFGSFAGLCEILGSAANDRNVLRDIIFACDQEAVDNSHYRRRMSLLLILQGIEVLDSDERALKFSGESFADLVYYGKVGVDLSSKDFKQISLPLTLVDIAERWKIYQFQSYLSVALQSLLVGIVRVLRYKPEGIYQSNLPSLFDEGEIGRSIAVVLGCSYLPGFFSATPEELLKHGGIVDSDGGVSELLHERHITNVLIKDKAAQSGGGLGLALILLFTLFKRYDKNVSQKHHNWYRKQVPERGQYTDICLPQIIDDLESFFQGEWKVRSNFDVANRIIGRFILLQHQYMSYERNAGNSSLFRMDEDRVLGTGVDYDDPAFGNARFGSAIQILDDLGLVYKDEDRKIHVTEEGRRWLNDLLDVEARR